MLQYINTGKSYLGYSHIVLFLNVGCYHALVSTFSILKKSHDTTSLNSSVFEVFYSM